MKQNRRVVEMERRRKNIIRQARKLLAEDADSFSLRNLAAAAGVSVPTIYNLIGNKDTLMMKIHLDHVGELMTQISGEPADDLLDALEKIVANSAGYMKRETNSTRASLKSLVYLEQSEEYRGQMRELFKQSIRLQTRAVQDVAEAGKLRGDIDVEALGEQIYRIHHEAALDWANRHCSVNAFRKRALTGVYLTLAADATADFREQLIARFNAL